MPNWMDPHDMFGPLEVLQLRAVNGKSLPKNPFIIGKTVEDKVGKIFSANTEARGTSYVIKVKSHSQFLQLLDLKTLIDGTEVEFVPHPSLNVCKCFVSCIEAVNMTEDELQEALKEQGVIGVRRITRKADSVKVNTPTLILTFNGTVYPEHVFFGLIRVKTRTYYPMPLICYGCYSFGHPKTKCSEPAVCMNCSQSHPEDPKDCKNAAYCKNCKENHAPSSKKCPKYIREEAIIRLKTDNGWSFAEARKEYEKLNGKASYASKLQGRLEQARQETEKDEEIKRLKAEIERMKILEREFKLLKAELAQLKAENTPSTSHRNDAAPTHPTPRSKKPQNATEDLAAATTPTQVSQTEYVISETDDEESQPNNGTEQTTKRRKTGSDGSQDDDEEMIEETPISSNQPVAATSRRGRGRPRKH